MTDTPLLTIGAFARAVGLSASALRYYDECGLLRPADVDETTGYRYYTPELARRARLIALMRSVSVPVEDMRVVLDAEASEARCVLDRFLSDSREQSRLVAEAVRATLDLLDHGRPSAVAEGGVSGPSLAAALAQVLPATGTPDYPALTGVLLGIDGGILDVVATNRYRLVLRALSLVDWFGSARALVAPDAMPGLIDRLNRSGEVTVSIAMEGDDEGDGVDLRIGGLAVATLDDPYPAHRVLVESLPETATSVVVDRVALSDAVVRAEGDCVDVHVEVEGSAQRLMMRRGGEPDVDPVVVEGVGSGLNLTIRLGSTLFLDAVASVVGPTVELRFGDALRAVELRDPHQPDALGLLMPRAEL